MFSLFRTDSALMPENFENILKLYQTCLSEFEKLNYEDSYVQEIRADIAKIEAMIKG